MSTRSSARRPRSVIAAARLGDETLRLSSAEREVSTECWLHVGALRFVAAGNRHALQGADAVGLALGFTVLKGVIDEIAGPLSGKVVIVPKVPAQHRREGTSARLCQGRSLARLSRWLPSGRALGHGVRKHVGRL